MTNDPMARIIPLALVIGHSLVIGHCGIGHCGIGPFPRFLSRTASIDNAPALAILPAMNKSLLFTILIAAMTTLASAADLASIPIKDINGKDT